MSHAEDPVGGARRRHRAQPRPRSRRRAASAQDEEPVKIGFVTHVLGNPFIQQIIDAAQFAADGPGRRARGPGTRWRLRQRSRSRSSRASRMPASTASRRRSRAPRWPTPINEIVAAGTPVVQFNLLDTGVKAPYVGERSVESGRILGAPCSTPGRRRGDRHGHHRQLLPRLPGPREPLEGRPGGARRRPPASRSTPTTTSRSTRSRTTRPGRPS